jgi:hypothetical protein
MCLCQLVYTNNCSGSIKLPREAGLFFLYSAIYHNIHYWNIVCIKHVKQVYIQNTTGENDWRCLDTT